MTPAARKLMEAAVALADAGDEVLAGQVALRAVRAALAEEPRADSRPLRAGAIWTPEDMQRAADMWAAGATAREIAAAIGRPLRGTQVMIVHARDRFPYRRPNQVVIARANLAVVWAKRRAAADGKQAAP